MKKSAAHGLSRTYASKAKGLLLFLMCLVAVVAKPLAAAAAPGKGKVARSAKVITATSAATSADDGAYRVKSGASYDLYLPPWFEPVDGKYDVVVHFHGVSKIQESNVKDAHLNAAVVSINLGVVADKYGAAFQSPAAFDALLAKTHKLVTASSRAKGAKMGRVALSAWSAGFASVGAIMKNESARARIDAVFLADGLHAAYSNPKKHTIEESSLAKYVRLSEEASRGEKLFVLTHSSIPTYGYANVTETVSTVLRLSSMDKEKAAPPASAPRKMQPIYQVNHGDFHVTGFEGTGVLNHTDHIWAMGETMYPMLATRWAKKPAPEAITLTLTPVPTSAAN